MWHRPRPAPEQAPCLRRLQAVTLLAAADEVARVLALQESVHALTHRVLPDLEDQPEAPSALIRVVDDGVSPTCWNT